MRPLLKTVSFILFLIHTIFNSANALSIYNNSFKYSSEYTDQESSLQYLIARYYDTKIPRFIEEDSFDLLNRYDYTDGNPLMNEDPSGHMSDIVATLSGISATTTAGNLITSDYSPITRYNIASFIFTAIAASTGIASMIQDDNSLAITSIVSAGLVIAVRWYGYTIPASVELAARPSSIELLTIPERTSAPPAPAREASGSVFDEHDFNIANGKHRETGTEYNPRGFNSKGIHHETDTPYNPRGFDWDGNHGNGTRYDARDFDWNGKHRNGTDYNARGFTWDCQHRNGTLWDNRGFNWEGVHQNGTRYGDDGYNIRGFNKWRYDRYNRDQDTRQYLSWVVRQWRHLTYN